jgi:carboxylesterase type B
MLYQHHLALTLPLLAGTSASIHRHNCNDRPVAQLDNRVSYQGFHKDGVEAFHGIKYGEAERFSAPELYTPSPGSLIPAVDQGPACPQSALVGESFLPLYLTVFRNYSEDCLSLNVNRPNGTSKHDKLPVMVFIHGACNYDRE